MSEPPAGKKNARAVREQRLAAALRANLKRRKAQTRGRAAGDKSAAAERPAADRRSDPD